jgi:hypothetical protein
MKKNLPNIDYFINVIVIQNSVWGVILGQDIPLVYPYHECTLKLAILKSCFYVHLLNA